MSSYKEQFFKDFADYYGIPFTITDIEQECYYREGCPTCGGDYEFEVSVTGVDAEGNPVWKMVDGKISDFLNSLT